MKYKGAMLFWVDVVNLVLLASLATTGVLMKWVLPRGGGRRGGVRPRDVEWLGQTRQEWGDVHFWIAAAFSAAIIIHLLLHAGWIQAAFVRFSGLGRLLGRRRVVTAN